jgi:hypothetical protein
MEIPHQEKLSFSVFMGVPPVSGAGLARFLGIFIPGRAMAGMPEISPSLVVPALSRDP